MEYFAIHFDGPWLQTALIKKTRNSIQILDLSFSHREVNKESNNVKQLYTKELSFPRKAHIVSSLSGKETISRSLQFEQKTGKSIKKALKHHAVSTIPLSEDDSIVQLSTVSENKSVSAVATATTHFALSEHLEKCHRLRVDPDTTTTHSSSLARFAQLIAPKLKSCYIVDIGMTETTCAYINQGLAVSCHTIEWGIQDFYQALLADAPNENPEQVAPKIDLCNIDQHRKRLCLFSQKFSVEVNRTLESFKRNLDLEELPLLVTGSSMAFSNTERYLKDALEKIVLECVPKMPKEDSFPGVRKYALCIGMTIDALSADESSLQFRQHPFCSSRSIKRFGAKVVGSTMLMAFLVGFSVWGAIQISRSSKDNLLSKLHIAKTIDSMKLEKNKPLLDEKTPVKKQLINWQNKITRDANSFPFIHKAPLVSEVISWLANLPIQGVDIRDIQYELVQCPTLLNLKERYLAKVQFKFQAPSVTIARKVHEMLLSGEGLVDPSLEITWETMPSGYRTSFFLKPKQRL